MFESTSNSNTASGDSGRASDFAVIAWGLATTVLLAVVLAFVLARWTWALYSWRLRGFIPLGALVSGYVAASGYYVAARARGGPPPRSLFVWIGGASVAAYFLIHFFGYVAMADAGKSVRAHISFGQYLNLMNYTPYLDLGHSPAMLSSDYRPGALSFLWGILEILLFAGAGWSLFFPGETTGREAPDSAAS